MATTTINGTTKGETEDFSKTGQMGSTGLPGSQGQKGQKGELGQKGQKGEIDQRGEKGDQGQSGQKGNTGQPGSQGQKGQKGDKGDACDEGWSLFGRHCYYFGSDLMTWYEAQIYCETKDGNLVKIENAAESRFLKSVAEGKLNRPWIGASVLDRDGPIKWVSDSTKVDLGFNDWAPNEPNYKNYEEECVHYAPYPSGTEWKWNDNKCAIKFGYICEK